jgi:hypothetical protein
MSERLSQIKQYEDHIEDLEKAIAFRDTLSRLNQNVDFKSAILQEYFINDSARMVHLSADPSLTPLQRTDALNMAQAAGHLKRWLSMQWQLADKAMTDLVEAKENLVILNALTDEDYTKQNESGE